MSSSIDVLIAERLEISEERARKLLRTLLKELRTRAREEGVRLPELGTFREENGILTFSPSPSLRRLVNQQYEGLPEENLSSAPGYQQEEDESIPTLLDESEDHPRGAPSSEPQQPPEGREYPIIEEESEQADDEESTLGPEPIHEMDEPEREPVSNAESADEPSPPPPRDDEPEVEPEPSASTGFRPPDSFQLVVGVLLLALLVGVAWFVLDRTNVLSSGPSPAAPETAVESDEQTAPAPEPDTAMEASPVSSDQQPDRFPGVDPSETTRQASGGAVGQGAIRPDASGWTIVVASLSSRAAAEDLADEYESRFSSVDVVARTVNNTTRYRVVIGRYDSEAAAQSALNDRASMLPADAWTHRLQ